MLQRSIQPNNKVLVDDLLTIRFLTVKAISYNLWTH